MGRANLQARIASWVEPSPYDLDTSTSVDTSWEATFAEEYWRLGPETKTAILGLLPDGWSFAGKRVLDFGCGPGRTLRHFLPEAEIAEVWGADIDAESIERLRSEHSPPLHLLRCGYEPPLGLEYGSFDLIWAISVFTHLTDNSIPWLLELHRLLKPDGLLIATYMGRWHSEILTGAPWQEDRVGMTVLQHNKGREAGGPMVMMSDWWISEHWGRAFEILGVEPQIHNQSWAVMRKRSVEVTPDDVARPAEDPREYEAVRENLRQTQRELENTEAELDEARRELERHRRQAAADIEAVRAEYERSLSWRVTRPLRTGRRIGRSLHARRAR
jgi:SAM-dependent methyltransferase